MKFGLVLSSSPRGGTLDEMNVANTRLAESASLHKLSLWFVDHLQVGQGPILECFAHLAHTAGAYPGVEVGTMVTCQGFRNPALLAKVAASLQFLTGGRFTLGLGAGWLEPEYRAYGYPYPPVSQRMDELEEALQIIVAMWGSEPVTFHGRHHHIDQAICQPAPEPRPTIMIGGGGEQRTLRIAARYGDLWNFNHNDPATYGRKAALLADRCREIDRDPETITLTSYNVCSVSRDPALVVHEPPTPLQAGNYLLAGTPSEVIAEINAFAAEGVRLMQLHFLDYPNGEGLNCFLEDVLPAFQA